MFHLNVTILKMDKILFSPNFCPCIRVSLTDSAARIIFLLRFFSYHVEPRPGFEPRDLLKDALPNELSGLGWIKDMLTMYIYCVD